MEVYQVRCFLELAKTLNFTRAAEACSVTQSALTKAISKLEKEVGGVLVHRERRYTQLTDLGAIILPALEQSIIALDAARECAKKYFEMTIAPLRIGVAPTISPAIVIDPLVELSRCVPGLEIHLVELPSARMTEALMGGEIHVGIMGNSGVVGERLTKIPLFQESYLVACCRQHSFTHSTSLNVKELQASEWLQRSGCEVWDEFRRVGFASGCEPRIAHRADQEAHLQGLAAAGFGAMLTPESTPLHADLVAIPIAGNPLRRKVEVAVMSGRCHSPALKAFVKLASKAHWSLSADRLRATVSTAGVGLTPQTCVDA